MNLSDLRNLASFWLDDLNQTYFTPTQLNQFLNNALFETQKLLIQAGQNYYLKPVQTSLIVNQSDYVLPSDFLKLHRLELVVTGTPPNEDVVPIAPITVNQRDLVPNHTGQPQYYDIKRNRLEVFPTPDSVLTLRLYYSPRAVGLTLDSDVPDVPDQYHEMIAILAAYDGFLKDGRDPSQLIEKRNFYINMMKTDAQDRLQDAPRSVVVTGDGAGQYFGYW